MAKSADAFRTISEVAEWMDTPAHVLRFWESKFTQIKPVKRAGGRRYYRPADMRLLGGIKKLLHEDGMTIKGAQKILREQGIKHVASLCALSVGEEEDVEDLMVEDVPEEPIDTVVPFAKPDEPAVAPTEETEVAETTVEEDVIEQAEPLPDDPPTPPEQDSLDLDAAPTAPEDATVPQRDSSPEEPEATSLPGFLQRSMEERVVEQETAEPASEEPEPEPATAVDAQPVLEEPGEPKPSVLTQLSRIKRLRPESAKEIAPVVERLRTLNR